MMEDDTERADLARRISEAGWHILRDEQVEDGYVVEFQQGDLHRIPPRGRDPIEHGAGPQRRLPRLPRAARGRESREWRMIGRAMRFRG